jgi:hypothetical protein
MKTAVEWLVDELYKQGISLYTPELIAEANKLFENQIKNAWDDGLWGKLREGEDNAESYYNETFKQQEQ